MALSLQFADRLTKLFSKGIVNTHPTPAFALAVIVGTAAWVAVATATRLPVSTTHAIVGALVGAVISDDDDRAFVEINGKPVQVRKEQRGLGGRPPCYLSPEQDDARQLRT